MDGLVVRDLADPSDGVRSRGQDPTIFGHFLEHEGTRSAVLVVRLSVMQLTVLAVLAGFMLAAVGCGGGDPGSNAVRGDQRYEGTFTVLQSAEHGPELCHLVMTSDPPQCSGLRVEGWGWNDVEDEKTAGRTKWGSWHVTGTYDGEWLVLSEPPGPPRSRDDGRDESDFSPACEEPDVIDASQGVAAWEAMSQDYGPFEIPDLVAAWASQPDAERNESFVGNVLVLPGSRQTAVRHIREHYAGPLCVVERDGPTSAELAAVQDEVTGTDARAVLGQIETASTDERRGVVVATVWVADQRSLDYVDERWGDLVELQGLLHPSAAAP